MDIRDIILYLMLYLGLFLGAGYIRRKFKFIPVWSLLIVRFTSVVCLIIWGIRLIAELVNFIA